MQILSLLVFLGVSLYGSAQSDNRVSTIDFVQILDDNKEEALYYYQNNWRVLREMAVDQGHIHSYQLLETTADETAPFHLMLITTYANTAQYELREDNFSELIDQRGPLKLMNSKRPGDFRNVIFSKEQVRHLY